MGQDIAGIYELIVGAFGLFLYSVAKNRFVLSAISSMFLIKTLDPDLMDKVEIIDDSKINLKAKQASKI